MRKEKREEWRCASIRRRGRRVRVVMYMYMYMYKKGCKNVKWVIPFSSMASNMSSLERGCDGVYS